MAQQRFNLVVVVGILVVGMASVCAGRPLLEWTCEAALGSRKLDRVLLSTDDAEIAAVGRAAGVEVPFLRPPHLAEDGATTLPVLLHVLDWLEENAAPPEALVLLQPTTGGGDCAGHGHWG